MQVKDHYRQVFDALGVAVWEHDFSHVAARVAAVRAAGVADFERYVRDHPEFVAELKRCVPINDVNDTALQLLGVPSREAFFRHLHEFLDPHDESFASGIVAIAQGAPTFVSETRVRHVSGEYIPVFLSVRFPPDGAYDRVTASMFDARLWLKSQRDLELTRAELDQALRAASVGEVSASIAHEVTQPLSAIVSHAHASRRWLTGDAPNLAEALQSLDELAAAAQYAGEVIKRLRNLLGRASPERLPVSVDEVVAAAVQLSRRAAPEHDIVVVQDLRAGDAKVSGDAVLLQQAVMNLLNNAIQAVQEQGGPRRYVGVATSADERSVRVVVSDKGGGFSDEALEQLFHAFYTTKSRGMGLGLSITRTAIHAHGGEIAASNVETGGARVCIRLPRLGAG